MPTHGRLYNGYSMGGLRVTLVDALRSLSLPSMRARIFVCTSPIPPLTSNIARYAPLHKTPLHPAPLLCVSGPRALRLSYV